MTEKNTEEKKTLADTVGGVLTKYRVFFLCVIVGLIVVAVAWGIISYVSSSSHMKGLDQLDAIMHTLSKEASAANDEAGITVTKLILIFL